MYLWDANILRHFGHGHVTLRLYLLRVPWTEIALPSVVVTEVLRGRCEFALKATPAEAPLAHQRLLDTQQMLAQFHIVVCDGILMGDAYVPASRMSSMTIDFADHSTRGRRPHTMKGK